MSMSALTSNAHNDMLAVVLRAGNGAGVCCLRLLFSVSRSYTVRLSAVSLVHINFMRTFQGIVG